jgi:chorismate mutase / prephenate dehydratase
MAPKRPQTPADLALRLDALDDKIHDLLIRRAPLAGADAAPLGGVAQQAATLRRLASRHKGELTLGGLVHIWREVMSAMPGQPRLVHVYAGDRIAHYRDLARGYFGSAVAMEGEPSPSAVLHACATNDAVFGVVPPPDSDENAAPWWTQLTPAGQHGARILARLPLVDEGGTQALGYVVGAREHEPSGDDATLVILGAHESLSRGRLQALMKQAGLETQLLAAGRESGNSQARQYLWEVQGFAAPDDPRFAAVLESAAGGIIRLVCVGGYAKPMSSGVASDPQNATGQS